MDPLLLKALSGKSCHLQLIDTEMPADLETPVSAFLKLKEYGARILLESVESGNILARYSFIGVMPKATISISENGLTIDDGFGRQEIPHEKKNSPLANLQTILNHISMDAVGLHPPLLGGAVGYISYDLVRLFERIPELKTNWQETPLALFYLLDTVVVFDHVQRRIKIITLTEDSGDMEARSRLEKIRNCLQSPLPSLAYQGPHSANGKLSSNLTRGEFCHMVQQAKEYISSGDIYQIVLSQRLTGTTLADPFTIYRALRMLNPSPYMFYLEFEDLRLIGSSPEALVKLDNGTATVRPIAGTRPRGQDDSEDEILIKQLVTDDKEMAEHVMLVDLGRNDLGRCCEIGTVKVTELMKVEKYSHVMHLTSKIIGRLQPELDQFDLFRAAFPAGTVTGAPKIRAMQLIEELEQIRRGPYAGAVGYFGLSGNMDWCISIRTIIWENGKYFLQAGAGIVADSRPEREYQETLDKIMALKRAVEIAEEGL